MARLAFVVLAAVLLGAATGLAVTPGEQLPDPALEARARRLSTELRCLVCQNQSIDDSDAALAVDLRRLVRERIAAGDSDAAIRDFLVARFGEFVLLRPPLSGRTIVLWALPVVALTFGGVLALGVFRRRVQGAPKEDAALDEEERRELDALIADRTKR